MKKRTLITASAVLCAAIGIGVHGQTMMGPTYDYLLPSPEGATPEGQGFSVLQDPFSPDAILIGTWNEQRYGRGWTHTVTRLTPHDPNWTTFQAEGLDNGLSEAQELVYNPSDRIYASGIVVVKTGTSRNSPSVFQWKVRSSVSGATGTWKDEDSFYFSALQGKGKNATWTPQYSSAKGLTTDSDGVNPGNVYACGPASDGTTYHWVVRRKSLTANPSWDTVRSFKSGDNASVPHEIRYFPGKPTDPDISAALFMVGVFNGNWTVLRSTNGGTDWESVDDGWAGASAAIAYDVMCDFKGDIYVAGSRRDSGFDRGWILRRSQDGGDTWEELLNKPHVVNSWLTCITSDDAGNVTLTGSISEPDGGTSGWGTPRWTVVRNSPNQSWEDSWNNKSFPFPGISSSGSGSLPTANGIVFMTGRAAYPEVDRTNVGLLRMVP
jgi:hypothetical protein